MAWTSEELQNIILDLEYELTNIEEAINHNNHELYYDSVVNAYQILRAIERTNEYGPLKNRYDDLVAQGTAENLIVDMNGGGSVSKRVNKQKVYVAKNGAKYVKNEKGQVRFISGASKTYMEKIRNKRKNIQKINKKSANKSVKKSAKKSSKQFKNNASVFICYQKK